MPPKPGILRNTVPCNPGQPTRNQIHRVRVRRERPWDPEVEFGGGVHTHGTSTHPKTVHNRANRTSLQDPPLALARLKDTLRQEKFGEQRAGITTEQLRDHVGLPIGTAWSELTNIQQDK